jgi:hypothetical protein
MYKLYICVVLVAAVLHEHVFTAVEQSEIKVHDQVIKLGWHPSGATIWPSGKLNGRELICVKCFHKQKQILDYGQSGAYAVPMFHDTMPRLGMVGNTTGASLPDTSGDSIKVTAPFWVETDFR